MQPFDLEAAKAGAPVIQRCGRPARIVDFALKNEDYPLAVVYTDEHNDEHVTEFSVEGKYYDHSSEDYRDLMMAPVKKTGWLKSGIDGIFFTRAQRRGPSFRFTLGRHRPGDPRPVCTTQSTSGALRRNTGSALRTPDAVTGNPTERAWSVTRRPNARRSESSPLGPAQHSAATRSKLRQIPRGRRVTRPLTVLHSFFPWLRPGIFSIYRSGTCSDSAKKSTK